jgi:hypothetical protein
VLAVTDSKSSWSYVNNKLSSAKRNTRCRLKRKLQGTPKSDNDTKKQQKTKLSCVVSVKEKLSQKEYDEKRETLKKEAQNGVPDEEHMKLLLEATYLNRREWLKTTPSKDLRLKEVLQQYPVFGTSEMIACELWLQLGECRHDSFIGL